MRVAYVVARFPKLSETFVLYEMQAMEELGIDVRLFPLMRARQGVQHAEADRWIDRAHSMPLFSHRLWRAQWWFLRHRPRAYFGAWRDVLRCIWRSDKFLPGALVALPKAAAFAREMERSGVDHVHAHFATHATVAAFVIRRLTGIPYSFTGHGSDVHVDRRMLREKITESAFAVTVSEHNRALMAGECAAEAQSRIRVVHCGIDLGVFGERVEAPDAGRPMRIVCVARFEPVKGHRHLVEACRLLAESGVEFTCHLIGDGSLRGDIESRIAAAGLGDRIRLEGAQPRAEVVRWLERADVFVLASAPTRSGRREGIPVVLMEAMACEVPVVATAISGIPELVTDQESGLLVPPADPAALASALERLIGDPEARRAMGRAGRLRVAAEFDLRRNASQLAELFVDAGKKTGASTTPYVVAGGVAGGRAIATGVSQCNPS